MAKPPEADLTDPAQLAAMHGAFGHFEHWRKHVLSTCLLALRAAHETANPPERFTDKALDAEAHVHPNYVEFLTRSLVERIAYENMIREQVGA